MCRLLEGMRKEVLTSEVYSCIPFETPASVDTHSISHDNDTLRSPTKQVQAHTTVGTKNPA